ncbi:hypothetical protein COE95_13065 [Bacillus toyonensis]|uniref:hypothetical protein n=1 Tax=Bacillus toyonensis TaxID=155322 RepID=UPI000BF88313|nr:hypothetical protein [Bacillus toyonensis]PEP90522.1 hypothetical protein CN583_17390 [Bacillus toyonensis]PHC31182.1 hypothetical protein COE95_13065 [Bacillus toyonensis]
MDFATLQNIIKEGLKGEEFETDIQKFNTPQLSKLLNIFYQGKLILEKASIVTNKDRIIVGGYHTTSILGRSALYAAFEFFLINDEPQCTIGISLPEDWIPSKLKALLNDIFKVFHCTYDISNSGIIISSISDVSPPQSTIHFPSVPPTVQEGLLFFTSFNGNGPVFSLLQQIFGKLTPLHLKSLFNGEEQMPGPLEAATRLNLPPIGALKFSNSRFIFQKEFISLANDMSIQILDEILLFQGSGQVHPDNTFKISCQLVGVRKKDQSDTAINVWVDPLGLKGLTIRKLECDIGTEVRGTVIGMVGEIALGTEGETDQIILGVTGEILNGNTPNALTASIKSGNPSGKGISLTKIIEGLSHIPIGDFPILKEIVIDYFEVYIVMSPEGYYHPIKKVTYYGLSLNTSMSLFGLKLKSDFQFIPEKGIIAKGELGKISLGKVLTITDASEQKGPYFHIDTTQVEQDKGYIQLSGRVTLFGLSQTLLAKGEQDNFLFSLDYNVRGLGNFKLTCNLKGEDLFEANATITFDFVDKTIPLTLGGKEVGSINLGTNVNGTMVVRLTGQSFFFSLDADLLLLGLPEFSVQLSFDEEFNNLSHIANLIYEKILSNAEEVIKDPTILLKTLASELITLTKELGDLLKNYYNQTAEQAAQLLKKGNIIAFQTVQALKKYYEIANEQIGGLLKNAGYEAKETLEGLYRGLGITADQAADSLIQLGYDIGNTVLALQGILSWDGNTIADKLNSVGFSTLDIGNSLSTLGWNAGQIVEKLGALGASALDVTYFLKIQLKLDEIDAMKELNKVYSNAQELTDLLNQFWGISTPELVTSILKRAEFSLKNLAIGVKRAVDVFFLGDNLPPHMISPYFVSSLWGEDFNIEEIATAMEEVYIFNKETLVNILCEGTFFKVGEIADFLKNIWEWSAEKIGEVFAEIRIDTDKILESLISVGFPEEDIRGALNRVQDIISGISIPDFSIRDIRDRFLG